MMNKLKIPLLILALFSLAACSGGSDSGNGSSISLNNYTFSLVKSQTGSSTRLDILYDKTFSGDISYIVSDSLLDIADASGFDRSGKSITTVSVASDELVYDDYITLSPLSGGTKYYVYIKTGGETGYVSAATYTVTSPGKAAITGKITGSVSGSATSYDYTITFPAGYGIADQKWPFLVNLKGSGFSNPNFPCVVFSIDVHSGSTTDSAEISNISSTIKTFIENPGNHIDLNRVYIFGYSAGGNAAIIIANNDGSSMYNIKAVMTEGVTSWVRYSNCGNLGNTSIWLFYGENDSFTINTDIITTLLSLPGNGEHLQSIMPGAGHDYTPVVNSPIAIMWLLGK